MSSLRLGVSETRSSSSKPMPPKSLKAIATNFRLGISGGPGFIVATGPSYLVCSAFKLDVHGSERRARC